MRARLERALRAALPLVQLTVAATAAWILARQVGGHDAPFFAPIAVVVALSSPLGERGTNAIRILLGVLLGIGAGELTVLVLGEGIGRLAVAMFLAMALARLLRGPRIVMVQAAASAILTVAAADGDAGVQRLVDGAIGAAVALAATHTVLAPEPVALVRRAAADALARIADALALTADALERHDDDLAEEGLHRLRDVRDQLTELARLRKAGSRVARRSALWRSRIGPVVTENENAGHLDLLGASCVVLARAVVEGGTAVCSPLAPSVEQLTGALRRMAADPGDRSARQAAADDALDTARRLAAAGLPIGPAVSTAVHAVEMVTVDVMIVAGVDPAEALAAVRAGTGQFDVPTPPATPRLPFALRRPLALRRPPRRR